MDDSNSSNNPIYGRNVKLDGALISDILGSFITAAPDENPFYLPNFRLCDLCTRMITPQLKDADVLQSLGCLYSLCMYYASTPKINIDNRNEMNCVLLIQLLASESLSILQEDDKIILKHPGDLYDEYTSLNLPLFDTFESTYDIAKDIARDLIKQVRNSTKPVDERTKHSKKVQVPLDCLQPHSIYLLCSLAMAHVCALLINIDKVHECPGLLEQVFLNLIAMPKIVEEEDTQTMATKMGKVSRAWLI